MTSSSSQKFDLVCDKEWIPSFYLSISQIAIAVGALFSGPFSDRFGRRKSMGFGFIGIILFGYALPFMPNWWSFGLVWALVNFPIFFTNTACAVYVVEIVGPTKRSLGNLRKIIRDNSK